MKAEGFYIPFSYEIQTPPKREPVNNVQWGLDTLTPLSRGLHVEGIPSSSCLVPSAFFAKTSSLNNCNLCGSG